jgi:amino acid adenylation domain-containing protein
MNTRPRSLLSGFVRSLQRNPDQLALQIGDEILTYAQLWQHASRLGAAVAEHSEPSAPVVAILANRSVSAYAGILGILATGRGYVPLNPKFPIERTLAMLSASGCGTVIAGKECLEIVKALLPLVDRPVNWLLDGDIQSLPEPQNRQIVIPVLNRSIPLDPAEPRPADNATAYLLFTSGSTGTPKGVPVSQSNVCSYLDYVSKRYQFNAEDRFSQNFDLTFDLSVHDLFACWDAGATLCVFPEQTLVPVTTIEEYELTVWFSVPSVGMFATKLGLLRPEAFPTLRLSLFCGEALSATLAETWQRAAPASILENIYGPTETTIAITHYRWDTENSLQECVNGIVPIGWIFENQKCCVADENLHPVAIGETGELCLTGSQVTGGYLNNPERTAAQFVRIESLGDQVWYRTGDLVRQDQRGCLYYLGRTDHQVKINGYRVELQEIDLVLREAAGVELAVAVPWPISEGTASGVVGVLCGADSSVDARVFEFCAKRLPRYMVPTAVYHFEQLPLNSNGKLDRRKIAEQIRRMASTRT